MATTAASTEGSGPARVVSRLNPANAVTASRFLLLPPIVWAVDNGYNQWATLFVVICGLLDKVDGLVAKIFNCRSVFGELFDAITDGICYGFLLILLAWYGWVPLVPVIAMVVLGLANSGMRIIYGKRAGRATNYKSYAMERLVAYTAYLIGFGTAHFEIDFYYWLYPPLMIAVVLHDGKRMLVDAVPGANA